MQCGFYFTVSVLADPATAEIYTLSLHDALPICSDCRDHARLGFLQRRIGAGNGEEILCLEFLAPALDLGVVRSEEHTSELQSLRHLVCRLLLEKKKEFWKINQTIVQYTVHLIDI